MLVLSYSYLRNKWPSGKDKDINIIIKIFERVTLKTT